MVLRTLLLPQCFQTPPVGIIEKSQRRQAIDLAALFGFGGRI
jgi:hypothetical protein